MGNVEGEYGRGVEVVHGDVEETLDLGGVQVHRQHPLDTRFGNEIGHQLRRNRRARLGAAILAGIAEIWNDGGDAGGRGAAQRIGDDQQLHQVVIRGPRGRLDDEHVLAADVFINLDENLLIAEALHPCVHERDVHPPVHRHPPRHGFCKRQVGIARDELWFRGEMHGGRSPAGSLMTESRC